MKLRKRINWNNIIRILGKVLLGFIGVVICVVLYLFATGGFNPEVVHPTVIEFNLEDNIQSNNVMAGPKSLSSNNDYDTIIIFDDTDIFLLPYPLNTTENDVTIQVLGDGRSIIDIDQDQKANEPIRINVKKDENGNNIGGVATIRANHGHITAHLNIIVDVEIKDFDFDIIKNNESVTVHEQEKIEIIDEEEIIEYSYIVSDNLFVGDILSVGIKNSNPTTSYNPTQVNDNFSYHNKQVLYYSTNEEVATVDKNTGEVNVLKEGEFEIKLFVFPTYINSLDIKEMNDFEYKEDYFKYLRYADYDLSIPGNIQDNLGIIRALDRKIEFTVQNIEVYSLSANNNIDNPDYLFDVHGEYTLIPEDFSLQLLPQPNSIFTADQLNYKLKDIDVYSSDINIFTIEKIVSPYLHYRIRILDFEDFSVKDTHILFRYIKQYENIDFGEEEISFTKQVPIRLRINNVKDISLDTSIDGVQLFLRESETVGYPLSDITIIEAEDSNYSATYTKVVYEIDKNSIDNEDISDPIIDMYIKGENDRLFIENGIVSVRKSGNIRFRAIIVKTNISGEPVMNQLGDYISIRHSNWENINIFDSLEYTNPRLQAYNQITIGNNETGFISLNNLSGGELNDLNLGNIYAVSGNENLLDLGAGQPDHNDNFAFQINSMGLIGQTKIFIKTVNDRVLDVVYINIINREPEPAKTTIIDFSNREIDKIQRGGSAIVLFNPNSNNALIDYYSNGYMNFDLLNSEGLNLMEYFVEFNSDLGALFIKLDAHSVARDIHGDYEAEKSYSSLYNYIQEIDDPIEYRISIALNAVIGQDMDIFMVDEFGKKDDSILNEVTGTPMVEGTEWFTSDDRYLTVDVSFGEENDPAVKGINYISSDSSIMTIETSSSGVPKFNFHRGGTVQLIAVSSDEFAVPTDPLNPDKGAYAAMTINVIAPEVNKHFVYNSGSFEEVLSGNTIILNHINDSRISFTNNNDNDITSVFTFEIEPQYSNYVNLIIESDGSDRIISIETKFVASNTNIRIKMKTDFGYEKYYDIRIITNVVLEENYSETPEIEDSFSLFELICLHAVIKDDSDEESEDVLSKLIIKEIIDGDVVYNLNDEVHSIIIKSTDGKLIIPEQNSTDRYLLEINHDSENIVYGTEISLNINIEIRFDSDLSSVYNISHTINAKISSP